MYSFTDRHIGPSAGDRSAMLQALGFTSLQELIAAATPAAIRDDNAMHLPPARSEVEVLAHLRRIASRNAVKKSLLGQGYYGTHVPSVIQRNVLENPAWYTSYTPYQPEISQGRLEALLNFQTLICDLTGLDIAGASLLDEPTAAAEAMTLMKRNCKDDRSVLWVHEDVHPQTLAVLTTRAVPLAIQIHLFSDLDTIDATDAFGVLLSQPGSSGAIRDLATAIERAHAQGALVAVATDLLALTMLQTPGELGADVALGSAQRFGVPMGFGGPHAGFMSVRKGLERSLPGRLVGVSVDSHGDPAYRLALQTREQHIRREKATSNICTAQALLAICSAMYASYHGWDGLLSIAETVHQQACRFAGALQAAGVSLAATEFFDTVTFVAPNGVEADLAAAVAAGFNLRRFDTEQLAVSFDETTTDADVDAILAALGVTVTGSVVEQSFARRTDKALQQEPFTAYRSETEMMRYLRRLSDLDLALDRSMIPLGSCTMKLNAATEMAAITWPEFANVHPLTPLDQVSGWLQLISELEEMLCSVTGYDAVSLQPNAGSQGEFAGLLAVAAYHQSRGEAHRNVCLIPSSAHGTNAASAVMAGMRVVVITCDDAGNIDMPDLRAKIAEHQSELAAIMITYPSTHGVYEETVTEVCELVHAAGGQVYVDGANMNALVGVGRPGKFGADVSHLNLHKTFCIPHGGGGPGVGPVAVGAHLAPFLPGDPVNPTATPVGPVSGSRFGSAGILPIPYAYILLMGAEGLKLATETAVLAANYVARRLSERFPILYTNEHGLVAHECIVDFRGVTKDSGVSVDDIAKRLIDFGFHAPTMSFPVAGTLMVEPTESESLRELDRFVDAMIAIADEIDDIVSGKTSYDDSALRNAPHTAKSLLQGNSDSSYALSAAYPAGTNARTKYWPPVGRIDGAFGDRNLVCTCAPVTDYA